MNSLYATELAQVYDTMYQSFIDYKKEYLFYSSLCEKHSAKSVIEFACGSGNLAQNFIKNFESYLGIDLSEDMLKIAASKVDTSLLEQGDMRNFKTEMKFDAAIITGRSTSYLTTALDFQNTLNSIKNLLNDGGVLLFDCIDGSKFLPYIKQNPTVVHKARAKETSYYRKTSWYSKTSSNPDLIAWHSEYFKETKGGDILLGIDDTVFKVFGQEEVKRLLANCGFVTINVLERKTYAFDTFVIEAKKN